MILCQGRNKNTYCTYTYVPGIPSFSMAVTDINTLPQAYTIDKIRIVLNLPNQLSDNIAPNTHIK